MHKTKAICLLWFLAASGCGSQAVLLDAGGEHLFVAFDTVALPGEAVDLRARLQAGDLLEPRAGCVVRFIRDGTLFKAAETDADGVAAVTFTPAKPGVYRFTAELSPNGFPDAPPAPRECVVACRKPDAPTVIVDLDKTLVASGFQLVLIGDPAPMVKSVDVMRKLAADHAVIYLTHRPDYFGPKSKAWLAKHDYPPGPVLLSDLGGFLAGSEAFKTRAIEDLRRRFKKIRIGIGDKPSDAAAYHAHGVRAFLILDLPASPTAEALGEMIRDLKALPDAVQVVTSWDQIDRAVFGTASYPRSAAESMLQARLNALQAASAPTEP